MAEEESVPKKKKTVKRSLSTKGRGVRREQSTEAERGGLTKASGKMVLGDMTRSVDAATFEHDMTGCTKIAPKEKKSKKGMGGDLSPVDETKSSKKKKKKKKKKMGMGGADTM